MTNVKPGKRSGECRELLQHIADYLDGELDATACGRIEGHCERCSDCMSIVDGLRETVGLCREAGAAPLPEAVRLRALGSVRKLLDGQ
jgi:anti-sigma factor (TIGR02949 family)